MCAVNTTQRVVITGMGAVSPFGQGVEALFSGLKDGQSAVRFIKEMAEVGGMRARVAGLVTGIDLNQIPRKNRRSMSRMSVYALLAAQEALSQAGLGQKEVQDGQTGLIMGSTIGSPENLELFFSQYLASHSIEQMKSMLFFRIMGHSVAANVAQALGITGRVVAPASACSTSSQAIGMAYEAIAFGKQERMLAGGADEFHPLTTATFDILMAASCAYNDRPEQTPRPFDKHRDGIVCAEGAGVLVLESYKSALARNAVILGEILGFSSTADPSSIASPDPHPVYMCMKTALETAGLAPGDIGYVNAHATGTVQGDQAESEAIAMLFGSSVPVSSLKGHLGHTMAASGVLESIASLCMVRDGMLIPTRNLDEPASRCSGIYLLRKNTPSQVKAVIKNNFAFGGINCTLVIGKA